MSVNSTNESTADVNVEFILSKRTRFWVLFAFEIPSLVCCIFLLYKFCFDRTARKALNNHVIIIVLIVTFFLLTIDIPNYLVYLYAGSIWPQIPINCYAWVYVDITGYYGLGILMAWASIERHILVFHHQWINTKIKCILLHYIPLAITTLYPCIFYIVLVFFIPCDHVLDYTQQSCGGACAYQIEALSMFDGFANGAVPTLIIVLFNIALFIRFIKQRKNFHRQVEWRKCRRMIIQLFSCSLPFFIFNLPLICIYVAQALGLPYGATGQFEMFVYFLAYFLMLCMPFVCIGSLLEISNRTKRLTTRLAPQ